MKEEKQLENVTFEELTIGRTASLTRTLSKKDIQLFAVLSGDVNPAHLDETFADDTIFHGVVGHGMWTGALISALLGTALPGPGTIYLNQNLDFKKPVRPGETIRIAVTVKEKRSDKPVVVFDCLCTNAFGETVAGGTATVLAPVEKLHWKMPQLPDVHLDFHDRFRDLIDSCRKLRAVKTAVVHPVTAVAIQGVLEAVREGLIEPVLIGPESRIRSAAEEAGVDISPYQLISTQHSHAAASKAVELAAAGSVTALMKGGLPTDELLSAVVPVAAGLRTERRISHVYVIDVPTYHKQLMITDAAINIAPTLDDKVDICRNAVDLWRVWVHDAAEPKVAILAATERVKSNMQATIDAACLCKMADRKQIDHGLLDGPLSLDLAISQEAVQDKGLASNVAGDADILLAPDLNSGNMVAKQLTFLGNATAAGVVLGARVPIILTSRADSPRTRLASCALAVRIADARERGLII
jgi:phosphate acetyltransferase